MFIDSFLLRKISLNFLKKNTSAILEYYLFACSICKHIIRSRTEITYTRMAQLTVDIGGSPGINCRGFCEYCYFKNVKGVQPLGCRYCLPFKKGCDYCTRGVKEEYSGFKDLKTIADETLANLQSKSGRS